MIDVIYQSNHHFVVGHGPHTCGSAGCVLCSSVMLLQDLGLAPNLTPEEFNRTALEDGAFDDPGTEGDELDIPKAVKRYGARVEDRITEGMGYERGRIFHDGGRVFLRVAFVDIDPNKGKHTIAGVLVDKAGGIQCLDPAIGHVYMKPDFTAPDLGWGHDSQGNKIVHTYRVVNLRGIFKA